MSFLLLLAATKIAGALALFALLVLVLFQWVFPWLEPRLPFTDVTVDESAAATTVEEP